MVEPLRKRPAASYRQAGETRAIGAQGATCRKRRQGGLCGDHGYRQQKEAQQRTTKASLISEALVFFWDTYKSAATGYSAMLPPITKVSSPLSLLIYAASMVQPKGPR